jgi:hypothetical protein
MNFLELTKAVEHSRKKIAKHNKILADLLAQCTHDRTVPQSQYMDGGYDYRATTTEWDECVICKKMFNIKTTRSGSFS